MKNLVNLYKPGYSDGYNHFYESIYFENRGDANNYAKSKHGNYAVESCEIPAIEDIETGEFYILQSTEPVTIYDSQEYKERRKKEILKSLSKEDRQILGYE